MERVTVSELRPVARCEALSEKEKQTLRLMVRGHDAKSMARQLGLSVHTVNERLRDARRKLEVSSSREAARLLFDAEGADPQSLGDDELGEAVAQSMVEQGAIRRPAQVRTESAAWIIGAIIMSIVFGLLALSLLSDGAASTTSIAQTPPAGAAAPAAMAETDAVRSAREWLELGDQHRWKDGWLATATSFRKLNTVERWSEVAEQVRIPLGAVVSRTALSQESVPAPPSGVEVIKFRTSFANRANAIETVSLAREGTAWKVVGIYID